MWAYEGADGVSNDDFFNFFEGRGRLCKIISLGESAFVLLKQVERSRCSCLVLKSGLCI